MDERAKALLTGEAGPELRTEDRDRPGVGARLDAERRRASVLGDVREAIFGAQDGLVSTLAVVSTVSGATNDRYPVLIAGIAAYVKYLRPEIKIIGVEPDDSNCLQAAMAAGERVVLFNTGAGVKYLECYV